MKKNPIRLIIHIIIGILLTLFYVFYMYGYIKEQKVLHDISDKKKPVTTRTERLLFEYYSGKNTLHNDLRVDALLEETIFKKRNEIEKIGITMLQSLLKGDTSIFFEFVDQCEQEMKKKYKREIEVGTIILTMEIDNEPLPPLERIPVEEVLYKVNLVHYYKHYIDSNIDILKEPFFFHIYKQLGIYCHDNDFLAFAVTIFETLIDNNHFDDSEINAWYGSCLTKCALYVSSPVEKVDYVSKGITQIEKAVERRPDNFVIRFIRIINYLSLPDFFQQAGIAYNDIIFLLDMSVDQKKMEYIDNTMHVATESITGGHLHMVLTTALNSGVLTKEQKSHIKNHKALEKIK